MNVDFADEEMIASGKPYRKEKRAAILEKEMFVGK